MMNEPPVLEWPKRLENLKKVYYSLLAFLQTKVSIRHELMTEELDLVSLAVNGDKSVMRKLLQLVVLAITNCDKKDVFVTRITQMSEAVQTDMMVFISEAMQVRDEEELSDTARLKKEKRDLAIKLEKLRMQMELLVHSKLTADKQFEELKMRNLDLENELVRRVKAESMHPDSLVSSLESSVIQKERLIASLQTQLDDERRMSESKISALKDELDMATERMSHMASIEASLQKYKGRMDELTDAKTKLRAVVEENESMKKQLKSLREQYELQAASAKQSTATREEVAKLKAKVQKLEEQVQDREKQVKELRLANKDLEEKLQLTEIRCKEATDQLDRMMIPDSSSEDSFYVRSPHPEEARNSRKNTMDALGFNEMASSADRRDRRYREIAALRSEVAQLKFLKTRMEEELQSLRSESVAEIARLKAEQTSTANLHTQETLSLTSKLHKLESELNALERRNNTEKSDLLAKVQFYEMHFKQVDEDLKSLKHEKETLMAETRTLRKEKEDLTARYVESREQEVKLVREVGEKQVRFQAAEAERTQIVQRLEEATNALRTIDGKMMGESEAGRLRAQVLEMERKMLALQSDLADIQQQLRDKDEQLRQTQLEATKWRHTSIQKDSDISFLARAKEELSKALTEERRLLFEVMQEMDTRLSDMSSTASRERASKTFYS